MFGPIYVPSGMLFLKCTCYSHVKEAAILAKYSYLIVCEEQVISLKLKSLFILSGGVLHYKKKKLCFAGQVCRLVFVPLLESVGLSNLIKMVGIRHNGGERGGGGYVMDMALGSYSILFHCSYIQPVT